MDGSAGGVARVHAPVPRDAAEVARPQVGRRLVDLLVREPFVVLVVALDALILTFWIPDHVRSDTWLALLGGRLVDAHWLPRHDTLTIWPHGAAWVDQQWLGQVLLYWLHAAGGLRLLLLAHVAVLVGVFAAALVLARRSGASSRSVALVGVLGLFVALPNSAARTQSLAYVLFVTLCWLLMSAARRPSSRVFLALPLLVVWANVHGSALLGAGLAVLWAVAELVRAGRRRDAAAARVRALALAVAAPLCLLVSPYGSGVVGYYHDVLGAGAFRDLVTEWQATRFPDQWPFFLLALPSLWLVARKPRTLSLFEHLALVFLLLAALDAVRNLVWFALFAIMVVPRALDAVWPVGDAPVRRRPNLVLSVGGLVLVVAAFAVAAARPAGWYSRSYPRGALEAVASAAAADPSLRVFSNESFSDWLLWNDPALAGRVAFDARFELLSSAQLHSIARFRSQGQGVSLAPAAGYRLLVLDPGTERRAIRDVLAEPGARALYRDSHVEVLLRQGRS
jgi:hypothetical protein